jgi:predicted ATPase
VIFSFALYSFAASLGLTANHQSDRMLRKIQSQSNGRVQLFLTSKEKLMRNRLQKISLKGFKTIREMRDFEPGSLAVLIGPNGAGKSNFITYFRMLAHALASPGKLQLHLGEEGGASMLLHDGPAKTREIEAEMTIVNDAGENQYAFRLVYAAGDTLIYAEERFRFSRTSSTRRADWTELGAGHREAQLITRADAGDQTARVILSLLRKIIVYQFHNTSATARMRGKWDVEDNRWLKGDAANIASFLMRLKESENRSYLRIVETIRLVLPFFADFELDADNGS